MVELRWLHKPNGNRNPECCADIVLQYREGQYNPYNGENIIWGSWRDVPSVVENVDGTSVKRI